ncbi:MAG TPA: MFS transporter [Candidatus Saccharimonadales bacterium]
MSSTKRLVLWICILASFVPFLDGSVVNVALPAITDELGGGFALQQWVVNAYAITLGAFMLIAGSLADLYGRQRVMKIGLILFGVTSLLCAIAPSGLSLILARAAQGVAGALLVPSSLALIMAYFKKAEAGKAIGSWTAWTGIAFIVGPLVGGLLVDFASWRMVFAINVVPIIINLYMLSKLDFTEQLQRRVKLDLAGAALGVIGLGGVVYGLIEQGRLGWADPTVYSTLIIGTLALVGFIWHERHATQPMLPLGLFKVRNFWVGNIASFAIYAGLALATFAIAIFVQQVGNYSALEAGLALLPITIIMFFLSSRFGALADLLGPRLFMSAGPFIAGVGFATMYFVDQSVAYWQLLPGILLFGIGLSITVAPLTTAILSSISDSQSGIASAVNNAVTRVAGLIAVAAIGSIVGQSLDLSGFHAITLVMASLMVIGGLISAFGIVNRPNHQA